MQPSHNARGLYGGQSPANPHKTRILLWQTYLNLSQGKRCKILASYGLFVDNDGLPSCVRWICPTMSTNSMRVPSMPLQDHWSILCCTKSSDFLRPRTIPSSFICVPLIIFPSSHRLRLPDYIHLSHLHSSNLLVKYGTTKHTPIQLLVVLPRNLHWPLIHSTQFPTGFGILEFPSSRPARSLKAERKIDVPREVNTWVSCLLLKNTLDGCKIVCSRDPRQSSASGMHRGIMLLLASGRYPSSSYQVKFDLIV